MAQGKKTFIFYSDWINMIREMPNEDAGELLKHILSYVNDENPETKNLLVKMAFGHMKPMIKSDLVKWEGIREKRAEIGRKGGKANAKQKEANAKQLEAVNVNVNVNDNVNDNSSLKKEPKKLSKVSKSDFPFTSDFFLNAWKEWLEYRKEIKKPYKTKTSEKTALQKLARENTTEERSILSIEQSIAGGYQGLFPYKNQDDTGKKKGFDPSNFTAEGINRIINGNS